MQLKVIGENPHINNAEVKYAANWMAALIMSPQLRKNLKITISFVKQDGVLGTTETSYGVYEEQYNKPPRKFLVRIDPRERRASALKILAHELVHVKQFARNELRDTGHADYTKWNKQIYDQGKVEYWDLPWEIEAYGREYGMYRRYIDHVKENKVSF